MNKKIVVSLLILVFVGVISIIFINVNLKNKSVTNKENLAINISTLSEEYMTNYLDEVKNTKEEDKENILIVTSEKKLKETYGAVKVIPAPNNQYYLQYKNAEDKNKALKEFKDLSISVSENIIHELSEDTALDEDNAEIENSLNEANQILETETQIINFLSENKGNWEVQGENIVFNSDALTNQYNEYVSQLQ